MNAVHVEKSSCIIHPLTVISDVMLNTNVTTIKSMRRSHINVKYVGESSVIVSGMKNMREVTMERKTINVRNVGKHFVFLHPFKHIEGFTQEENSTNVRNVGKPSAARQDLKDM